MLRHTPNLTPLFAPETEKAIRKTYPGMASWAGEGPFATTCGQCEHFGCFRKIIDRHTGAIARTVSVKACAKAQKLKGGKIGPVIPKHAESCRFFEKRGD